jgi:signal transduction histidine kinase
MADRPAGRIRRTLGGVRVRITLIAMVVVLVVLVITGVVLVDAQRRSLTASLDEALEQGADRTEEIIEQEGVPSAVGGFGDDDTAVQVVDDGIVVVSTANVDGAAPIALSPDGDDERIVSVDDLPHEEGEFRVLSRVVDGPTGDLTILVGAPTDDIDEAVATLAASLTIAVPIVVLVLGGLVWVLVGRTLRPVDDIRAEVAAINASELDRRVPEPATDDEIARLARTMNEMLERVERSVERQQAFVADASHELRTPLTRMRSELEVDVAHPDRSDLLATHRSVLDETVALERLLDDLLVLARLDSAPPGVGEELVDLDEVVVRCARRGESRVPVDVSAVQPVRVRGRGAQLARAVGNVVDNAVRHAATEVTCDLVATDGTAVLVIADDGPGIPPEDAERVFERFTRIDESRSSATGGAGLGLAIAREIVVRHGGDIRAEPGTGARLVIRLPLAPT